MEAAPTTKRTSERIGNHAVEAIRRGLGIIGTKTAAESREIGSTPLMSTAWAAPT